MPPRISRAINEAFLNVVHHAYYDSCETENHSFISRRWWLYCYIEDLPVGNLSDKEITFLIYDKGRGIPFTVSDSKHHNIVRHEGFDHELIQTAFKSGFTCTPFKRGLGTDCLKMPLYKCQDSLLVYSGKGTVYFSGDGTVHRSKDLKVDVDGTLLEWKLYI